MTGPGGDVVRITLRGRVRPEQAACVQAAGVEPVAFDEVERHTVLVTDTGDIADLVAVLRAMQRRGWIVDRIRPRH